MVVVVVSNYVLIMLVFMYAMHCIEPLQSVFPFMCASVNSSVVEQLRPQFFYQFAIGLGIG